MSECSICLEIINADERELDCHHSYHKLCIEQWLIEKNNCPMCRCDVHPKPKPEAKSGNWFNYVEPYQHHSMPSPKISGRYHYSFALFPEDHQPSGTMNFSRIDDTVLTFNLSPQKIL